MNFFYTFKKGQTQDIILRERDTESSQSTHISGLIDLISQANGKRNALSILKRENQLQAFISTKAYSRVRMMELGTLISCVGGNLCQLSLF